MLGAGTLRTTIQIERLVGTKNNFNEVTEEAIIIHEVRANVKPISSREYFSSNLEITKATHIFKIRYVEPLINTSDSIIFQDKKFDITSVINIDNKSQVLEIIANKIN